MCGVPSVFTSTRARLIEQDLAIPLTLGLNAGVAFRDLDVADERTLRSNPHLQELYPPDWW
jgi:hypothetical protein